MQHRFRIAQADVRKPDATSVRASGVSVENDVLTFMVGDVVTKVDLAGVTMIGKRQFTLTDTDGQAWSLVGVGGGCGCRGGR